MNIALLGNPNCGKTTLFNALTGKYQKVGNFAGVTVEKKEGVYKKDKSVKITDLPGLYSLSADSADERAVTDFLQNSPPQAIINVLDGTNLERNLYLTCELLRLNIPVVLAVNFCDDLEKNGIELFADKLSLLFGVPAVKISALKGKGLEELIRTAKEVALQNIKDSLNPLTVAQHTNPEKPKPRAESKIFAEQKTAERFTKTAARHTKPAKENVGAKEIPVGAAAYLFIERNIEKIIRKKETRAEKFTRRADDVLTHKIWGIPIFLVVMTLVYFLSLKIGGAAGKALGDLFGILESSAAAALRAKGAEEWATSFLTEAVIKGTGTALTFLPQILVLFLLLSVIEESGYAARIAFDFDRLFRAFGLSGKSLLPLTVSCGCAVTGITASRTIESEGERRATVFLAPMMPCGAKTAVFGWFAAELFGGSAIIASSAYFLSIIAVAIFGKILKSLKPFGGSSEEFLLEMPTLRAPSVKDVFFVLWEKTKDFLFKAGTVIFTASVLLWVLKNVGFTGYTHGAAEKSLLYYIGNKIKYIFYPLGFTGWESSVALISGIFAKEAVAETLALLAKDPAVLFESGYSAYAFMVFVLLSPPCVSALSVAYTELKSAKLFAFMLFFQFAAAYSFALVINLIGNLRYGLFNGVNGLIFSLLAVIIMVTAIVTFVFKCVRGGCGKNCPRRKTDKVRIKSRVRTLAGTKARK